MYWAAFSCVQILLSTDLQKSELFSNLQLSNLQCAHNLQNVVARSRAGTKLLLSQYFEADIVIFNHNICFKISYMRSLNLKPHIIGVAVMWPYPILLKGWCNIAGICKATVHLIGQN